jgi:hypothetical protein
MRQGLDNGNDHAGNCSACDDGYWWIIPTSGHRAYPYLTWNLEDLFDGSDINMNGHHPKPWDLIEGCPQDWPDHYECNDKGTALPAGATVLSIIAKLMPKMRDRRF